MSFGVDFVVLKMIHQVFESKLNNMHRFAIFLLLISLGYSCSVTGQQTGFTHARNASEKTKASYKKAYTYVQQKDYPKATKEFEKLIKKDPTFINSYLVMSDVCLQQKNETEAVEYLKKAIAIAPDYDPRVYLSLGRIAMNKEDYVEAAKQSDKFLSYENIHPNLKKVGTKMNIDAKFRPLAIANPVPFEPKNLGENINSSNRDYFPSITLKDELVYTIQFGQGQRGQEDLYISRKDDNGWKKSEPIASVNTPENEGAQNISADGTLLVYTVCNRPGDMGSCDLYFSKKINGKWTPPQNIGAPINTANWESQPSIAPNGDALFFVRGGARGQGNKDLYYVKLNEDGSWDTPQPISELNTKYDESAPCIHPDGKTLYFSSEGHEGMGSFDLFISRKQEDGSWGKPQNLGYPINTSAAEEAIAVSRKGDIAYLASDRDGGFGSLDIYSFELPINARPEPVTYIQGITKDAETGKSLSAYVEIYDLKTQNLFAKFTTRKDGEFTVCMPTGDYALNARRPEYAFFSANYSLTEAKKFDKAYRLEALLQPLQIGNSAPEPAPIVLENVFFESASAKLKDISKTELNKLQSFLEENKNIKIVLNGHTDNVGSPESNMDLSNRRANAVKDYLINQGIDASRLSAKGYGETKPRASNDTDDGRALNRRTEFEIIN